jgi:hypothetical protein
VATRAARHHHGPYACVDEPGRERGRRGCIEITGTVEHGHQGDADAGEDGRHTGKLAPVAVVDSR